MTSLPTSRGCDTVPVMGGGQPRHTGAPNHEPESRRAADRAVDGDGLSLQVKHDTPPTFLVHASDDTAVPVEHSLLLYQALRRKHIPAELHVPQSVGHGFGLAVSNPQVAQWTILKLWLQGLNKARQ